MPKNESEWKAIETEFNNKWNFPHCIGAFDGKHICLKAPMNSDTEYFNYKGMFSIVLFGIVISLHHLFLSQTMRFLFHKIL